MMQIQPHDLERAFTAMGGRESPMSAVGSALGFSPAELESGVPAWAWAAVAFGVGIFAGQKLKERGVL